jgi:hypothetical protein
MVNKATKPFRMAPLQQLAVKPVEDPAEQAALDARLKRSKPMETLAVLEQCRQLSAEGRLLVATELAELLSLDQRIEWLERWTAQLPSEAIRGFKEDSHRQARPVPPAR